MLKALGCAQHNPDKMRADKRHNKNYNNLKSSLKKGGKLKKKNRVVFDETANEFFEADYIIVVRDDCSYSDDECTVCEPLSPPEGYKDGGGLFNKDGTLRETAWYSSGMALLVGERSGTVFTPHHLQLLRRLQQERMLRNVCADCHEHHHHDNDFIYEAEFDNHEHYEDQGVIKGCADNHAGETRGKHIVAGEERPSIAGLTPTEDCVPDLPASVQHKEREVHNKETFTNTFITSEESDTADTEGDSSRYSSEGSPASARRKKAGILKGGKLWKSSLDNVEKQDNSEQSDDQRSTPTSGEDSGQRSVRFSEEKQQIRSNGKQEDCFSRDQQTPKQPPLPPVRYEHPVVTQNYINQGNKASSAVFQLFNSSRPPPPTTETHPLTMETLRAWESERKQPKTEDLAIRRVAERNALRCSLQRSEAKKKTQNKIETTSLAERIRQLTCDIDEEKEKLNDSKHEIKSGSETKVVNKVDNVKHHSAPDVADTMKNSRTEPKRHLLGTLTACVGSTGGHDPFYYQLATNNKMEYLINSNEGGVTEKPAPDVVAGTPGGPGDGEDGLAAFAKASSARTDRLKQKYCPENDTDSDEHDDYGFNRRPTVRGVKNQSNNGMQNHQMQCQQSTHVPCTNNYSGWPYYSETNLVQNMHSNTCVNRISNNAGNWSGKAESVQVQRACSVSSGHSSQSEGCYIHTYAQAYPHHQESLYQNYDLYATVRCTDGKQEIMYGSEQGSPVSRQNRRPESPPPIRNYHQTLLYIPYGQIAPHCHNPTYANHQYAGQEYNRNAQFYHNSSSGTSTAQQISATSNHTTPLHVQVGGHLTGHVCQGAVSARYRTTTAQPVTSGQHMISYSEKVAPPLYQPAQSSPAVSVAESTRGAPEGAPATATSPISNTNNSLYYAMNV